MTVMHTSYSCKVFFPYQKYVCRIFACSFAYHICHGNQTFSYIKSIFTPDVFFPKTFYFVHICLINLGLAPKH